MPAQPAAVCIGVDGDHVDLADDRLDVGVQLGPAETQQATVLFEDAKAGGVEPGLGHAQPERVGGPATLLAVGCERPVVHREPGGVVDAGDEGTSGDRRVSRVGERAPHLVQLPSRDESEPGGEAVVVVGRVAEPPRHGRRDSCEVVVDGCPDDVVAHLDRVGDGGAHDDLQHRRLVRRRDLGERDQPGRVGDGGHQRRFGPGCSGQVEPEVVAQGGGTGGGLDARRELERAADDARCGRLRHLDESHGVQGIQARRVNIRPLSADLRGISSFYST